jgi:glycosyltransferase involved in cell wall biosynthesis
LHFICPTGFYGAEKWILSLVGNIDASAVVSELAVIRERGEPELKLTNEFRSLGLEVHEIDAGGRFDLSVIGKLVRLLRERRIDVLHTHGYKPDILGVIAARRAGVRRICTTHGFENAKDLKLQFYIWLGCQSFRFFDKVVSLSERLRSDVLRYGVSEERTQIITSGIDLRPMKPFIREREPGHYHDPDSLTIGFIGQMISRKNIIGLLDAFDELARINPTVQLELIGDGSDKSHFQQHATRLAAHERIHFRGFVDNPLEHLQQLDLFVMTSTLEGTPLCLMEAMAMGVPVVAFDIPGVDLLIKHKQTGLLAPTDDLASLVSHCAELLSDPAMARRLAAAARQRVLDHFSATRMAGEYLSLYQSLIHASA